jgi:hypothetical protein
MNPVDAIASAHFWPTPAKSKVPLQAYLDGDVGAVDAFIQNLSQDTHKTLATFSFDDIQAAFLLLYGRYQGSQRENELWLLFQLLPYHAEHYARHDGAVFDEVDFENLDAFIKEFIELEEFIPMCWSDLTEEMAILAEKKNTLPLFLEAVESWRAGRDLKELAAPMDEIGRLECALASFSIGDVKLKRFAEGSEISEITYFIQCHLRLVLQDQMMERLTDKDQPAGLADGLFRWLLDHACKHARTDYTWHLYCLLPYISIPSSEWTEKLLALDHLHDPIPTFAMSLAYWRQMNWPRPTPQELLPRVTTFVNYAQARGDLGDPQTVLCDLVVKIGKTFFREEGPGPDYLIELLTPAESLKGKAKELFKELFSKISYETRSRLLESNVALKVELAAELCDSELHTLIKQLKSGRFPKERQAFQQLLTPASKFPHKKRVKALLLVKK